MVTTSKGDARGGASEVRGEQTRIELVLRGNGQLPQHLVGRDYFAKPAELRQHFLEVVALVSADGMAALNRSLSLVWNGEVAGSRSPVRRAIASLRRVLT